MFDKALKQVLFGLLFMAVLTLAYGTFYDRGFAPSLAGVAGLGDDGHHGKHEEHHHD